MKKIFKKQITKIILSTLILIFFIPATKPITRVPVSKEKCSLLTVLTNTSYAEMALLAIIFGFAAGVVEITEETVKSLFKQWQQNRINYSKQEKPHKQKQEPYN